MNINDFKSRKAQNQPISMLTCYDFWSAQIVNHSKVDCLLVGDSSAMVMHGHESTIPATLEMIETHIAAVKKGAPDKFIVGDMPFLTFRADFSEAVKNAGQLMKAGAQAVKLEGCDDFNLKLVKHLVGSGIPVMGHLGLTPQFVNQMGGYHVQGKEKEQAQLIKEQALQLQEASCFSIVLECVPSALSREITESLNIPTIGIGAGQDTDGQVLVMQDMLGMNKKFKPKFLRTYLNGYETLSACFDQFHEDVSQRDFPSIEESYE